MPREQKKADSKIKFRQGDNIGNPDALYDTKYLKECFIEAGSYEVLLSGDNIRSLIVGRTGTGKTAHIQKIILSAEEKNYQYVEIQVEEEFWGYLSQLHWLKKISEDKGVNLSPFFKNLWQHIIVVDMIKKVFPSKQNFTEIIYSKIVKIGAKIKTTPESRLKDYVEFYGDGDEFWTSDDNIKKVTEEITKKVKFKTGVINAEYSKSTTNFESGQNDHEREDNSEIQDIINSRKQTAHLKECIRYIGGYISKNNRPFYVLIDKLDEEWIDDRFRYLLIKALIEVIQGIYSDWKELENRPKIIVALRKDLIEKVYDTTRSAGSQSEKYRSFEINMLWTKNELRELVEKRINYLCSPKYEKRKIIQFEHIFPVEIKFGKPRKAHKTFDYMVERTLYRPRDIIAFVNVCITLLAEKGSGTLSEVMVKEAEKLYSEGRYDSIIDEWKSMYPFLSKYASILKHDSFRGGFVDFSAFIEIFNDFIYEKNNEENDPFFEKWVDDFDKKPRESAICFLEILYKTGLIKIKPNLMKGEKTYPASITQGQYENGMRIIIHPMFHAKLGVRWE